MTDFKINLIRDRVMPAARRRFVFAAFCAYVAISGAVLVFAAYRATLLTVRAVQERAEGERLALAWRAEHPDRPDLFAYETELRDRVMDMDATLVAVDEQLDQRHMLGGIMQWLDEALPEGVYLMTFNKKDGFSEVTFQVAVPVNMGSEVDANDLLERWRQNEELSDRLLQMRFVISQRQKIERQSVYLWKYSGQLRGGAG